MRASSAEIWAGEKTTAGACTWADCLPLPFFDGCEGRESGTGTGTFRSMNILVHNL